MKEINSNLLFQWAVDLFPLNRSLSGEGVRSTLTYFKRITPELEVKEFASGTKVFDWDIPDEWDVSEAYIEDMHGNRVVDFSVNNLHLVGYSIPIDKILTKDELEKNIHFLINQPDVIPYVTSYYKKSWGFCLTYNMWKQMPDESYHVVIRSKHFQGSLTYGEVFIQGESSQEILLSSYVCHPSMFSNELSGPIVLIALFEFLKTLPSRHYSYRGLLLPETIGSIAYLSQNLQTMKRDIIAGWVLTCLADEGKFSYIPSRLGQSYADKTTLLFAQKNGINLEHYTWLDRGSDERQYGAPGIDLPICSITRTKYGKYPEYHTSADNLSYGSKEGLFESFKFYQNLLLEVESSRTPKVTILGEPQMGKRDLYPTTSGGRGATQRIGELSARQLVDIISFADGQHNVHEIARKCKLSFEEVSLALKKLENEKIIRY
jgi:aminopeptidase-like protein